MKKLFGFIFCLILLTSCLLTFNSFSTDNLNDFASSYNVTFNSEVKDINFDIKVNGSMYHLFNSKENYNYVNSKYKENIVAETFVFNEGFDYELLLQSLNFYEVRQYQIGETTIIEGYTPKLNKYVKNKYNKLNLQIAISNIIKIGYPYIAEGF